MSDHVFARVGFEENLSRIRKVCIGYTTSGEISVDAKRSTVRPRDVVRRLVDDGWTERKGWGDHRNFVKPGRGVVTIDAGVREIPIGTLRGIYRVAGWQW
ncbi:MAG: type II toxin-antitoxin system HicA family toxin [Bauldia sp.]